VGKYRSRLSISIKGQKSLAKSGSGSRPECRGRVQDERARVQGQGAGPGCRGKVSVKSQRPASGVKSGAGSQ